MRAVPMMARRAAAHLPLWVDQHEQSAAGVVTQLSDRLQPLGGGLHEADAIVRRLLRLREPHGLAIDAGLVQPLLLERRRHARHLRREPSEEIPHHRGAGCVQLHDAALPRLVRREEVGLVAARQK